jgi:hypothetical protein
MTSVAWVWYWAQKAVGERKVSFATEANTLHVKWTLIIVQSSKKNLQTILFHFFLYKRKMWTDLIKALTTQTVGCNQELQKTMWGQFTSLSSNACCLCTVMAGFSSATSFLAMLSPSSFTFAVFPPPQYHQDTKYHLLTLCVGDSSSSPFSSSWLAPALPFTFGFSSGSGSKLKVKKL